MDTLDSCPTQAEIINGYQDTDGCPDVAPIKDSDNDGIPDNLDNCPLIGEIYNNYQDSDGCPDVDPKKEPARTTEPSPEPVQDNSLLQWTAVIAASITAVGAIGAAKLKRS